MYGDRKQYDVSRPSTGAVKPRGFKPKDKNEKPDMAAQISGSESKD